jgi:hypothetical protein
MKKLKPFMWIFLFGSFWGLNEVFLGEILYRGEVLNSSVFLTVIALFLLSVSRAMFNKPGSSTLIGTVAVLFRLANTAPSYCHLLGIFVLGLTFDVFATLLIKKDEIAPIKWGFTGAISAFTNNALFALLITYVFRYEYWVVGGFAKVSQHIFVSGTISALLAIFFVPLGFMIGKNSAYIIDRRPRWSYAGTILGSIALWSIALFLN